MASQSNFKVLAASLIRTLRFCTVASFENSNFHGHYPGHLLSPRKQKTTENGFFSPKFDLHKNQSHLLRLCAQNQSLWEGKALHCCVLKTIPNPPLFLSNSLANMYAKCGVMTDARHLFDEIPQPDVVSWNTMITGYFLCGSKSDALSCYAQLLVCGFPPDDFTFGSVIKCCDEFGLFDEGLQAHCSLTKFGLRDNAVVGSALIMFYANFGRIEEAMKVFGCLVFRDTGLINTIIGVVAKAGDLEKSFGYFQLILCTSLVPTRATFVNLLSVVDGFESVKPGTLVHGVVIKYGLEDDGTVVNSLVKMYTACNAAHDAFDLLVYLGNKDVRSWTTLISGNASQGCFLDAMDAFSWFYREGQAADSILLASVLTLSANSECVLLGAQIHCLSLKMGIELEECIRDALVDMYAKCTSMDDAMMAFREINGRRNLYSWTTVISGYVYNGLPMLALSNFCQMHKEGLTPDSVACISGLTGCIDLKAVDQGLQIHAFVIKSGCLIDISVQTALLSLYAEAESLDSVCKLFKQMPKHDVVSWTALISVYANHGYNADALVFLIKMLSEGTKPNHFTFSSALTACGKLTAYEMGRTLHSHTIKISLESNKFVGCALIDMYSKCGSMENAIILFKELPKHDIVLWNALLAAHGHHGSGMELIKAFDEMQIHGIKPDQVTFLTVLSGCSHSGLVDRVMSYFHQIHDQSGMPPMKEHNACIVDALGRAGLFKEAVDFIEGVELGPGLSMLRSLLSCCVIHARIQLGLTVVAKLLCLGENNVSTYVLLSNLYGVDGRWDEANKVREVMEWKLTKEKKIGLSWVESKNDFVKHTSAMSGKKYTG